MSAVRPPILTVALGLLLAACGQDRARGEEQLVEFDVPASVLKVDTASAVLIEFGAALCPACRRYAMQTAPKVTDVLERDGRLRTLYIEHSVDPIEGEIFDSVACSGLPTMVAFRQFYANKPSGDIRSRDSYIAHASGVFKRDTLTLRVCMDSSDVRRRQTPLREQGKKVGVSGTPTFVLGVLLANGQFRGWPTVGLERDSWIGTTLTKAEAAMQLRSTRRSGE